MGLQSRRYESMKLGLRFMKWGIPDPAYGESAHTQTHPQTLSTQMLPFLHQAVSLTPTPKRATLLLAVWCGSGADIPHQTRHLLQTIFQQLDALTFIPNTSMRLQSRSSRSRTHTNKGETLYSCATVKILVDRRLNTGRTMEAAVWI